MLSPNFAHVTAAVKIYQDIFRYQNRLSRQALFSGRVSPLQR